jgi:hypothetical protein
MVPFLVSSYLKSYMREKSAQSKINGVNELSSAKPEAILDAQPQTRLIQKNTSH